MRENFLFFDLQSGLSEINGGNAHIRLLFQRKRKKNCSYIKNNNYRGDTKRKIIKSIKSIKKIQWVDDDDNNEH